MNRLSLVARLITLQVVLLLALSAVAHAAPLDGVVTGQVVNKTSGGGSTGGVNVVLVAFGRKEQAPLGQFAATTDADGRYRFTDLDRDPNVVYITLARFQSVNYPTDNPFQLIDQGTYEANIDVYDATTDDGAIQFERLNLLVLGAQDGVVQFMQMGALVNSGDKTFVTANPQDQALARAIKFALPAGALAVQMQTGFSDQDVVPGVGGIQVTTPAPGRHEFALSFQLPYHGSSADTSLQLPYQTGTFNLYLPDTGVKLDTGALVAAGPAQLGGQTYMLYSTSNVPRATMLSTQLSGLASSGASGPTQLGLISLGVVLFVLGAGVLIFGGRFRGGPAPAETRTSTEQERLELVVRLAALDERYAAGELSQAEYEAERDAGKQRLRELLLASRTPAPTGA